MIQRPIHKESCLLNSWINQRLNESNEDIYCHLLADLVSYLEYHLTSNNKNKNNNNNNSNNNNNKNIKGIVHPKNLILSSFTSHVVSNLSFVEHKRRYFEDCW